ncbi:hypothetical protein [Bacillus sp. T33-2]|nr:hypothetical protein [Bacillus sp. T33-2]
MIPLFLKQEKTFSSIRLKDLFVLFLQALAGVFLFNIFMLYGLKSNGV